MSSTETYTASSYTAKAAQAKKDVVAELVDLMKSHKVIAAVDMMNLPAAQLQSIKASIRSTVISRMAKQRLIRIAIDQAGIEGLDKLKEKLTGMPALLFTNDDPFLLYKKLSKSKTKAPMKAGQQAPEDIVVPAGPTSFTPGPMISELASVGIKTKVDGGKISVIKDTVVAKEGEVIDAKKASVLSRLDIKPMPIGLNMTAAWEGGVIYAKSILAVDEQEYLNNIKIGHLNAFALAMHVGHPAPEVVRANITKAQRISVGIALHCAIPTKDTIGILMARAVAHANAVNAHV